MIQATGLSSLTTFSERGSQWGQVSIVFNGTIKCLPARGLESLDSNQDGDFFFSRAELLLKASVYVQWDHTRWTGLIQFLWKWCLGWIFHRCREILEGRRQKSSTEEEWRSEGNKGHGAWESNVLGTLGERLVMRQGTKEGAGSQNAIGRHKALLFDSLSLCFYS